SGTDASSSQRDRDDAGHDAADAGSSDAAIAPLISVHLSSAVHDVVAGQAGAIITMRVRNDGNSPTPPPLPHFHTGSGDDVTDSFSATPFQTDPVPAHAVRMRVYSVDIAASAEPAEVDVVIPNVT